MYSTYTVNYTYNQVKLSLNLINKSMYKYEQSYFTKDE